MKNISVLYAMTMVGYYRCRYPCSCPRVVGHRKGVEYHLNSRREEEGGEKLSSKSDRISSTMETFRNFLPRNLSIFLFAYILDGGEKIGQNNFHTGDIIG